MEKRTSSSFIHPHEHRQSLCAAALPTQQHQLVTLGAAIISAITLTLLVGIPLVEVAPEDAESEVELFNSYSGVIMGFVESGISVLLGYLFPVFIVYLHNLKWLYGDDPAKKPISKAKKIALLLFFPIVMVAIGNSLSAVQTNQSRASASSTRRVLTEVAGLDHVHGNTVFSSAVVGGLKPMEGAGDDPLSLQRVAAGTRVRVGVPIPPWLDAVVPSASEMAASLEGKVLLELLVQGAAAFHNYAASSGITIDVNTRNLEQLAIKEVMPTVDHVVQEAQALFARALPVPPAEISISHTRSSPHAGLMFEQVSIKAPMQNLQPSTVVCGEQSCMTVSSHPLARLRTVVTTSPYTTQPSSAVFLFGLTTTSSVSSAGAVVHQLELTFARVSSSSHQERGDDSTILGLQLSSGHHLIKCIDPGSTLPTGTVLEIVQPPVLLGERLASAVAQSGPASSTHAQFRIVDAYSSFLRRNHLTIDELRATVYLAAVLSLFHDAVVTPPAPTLALAWERHLQLAQPEYQIYVSNTRFGAISTWTACGILFVLSALVLLFPNARARLEPPKGGNARAERFIAVQTEEVYPNLIYKKRFRIGKTGEKIKFREFAVEGVTLHHRMEEDEQIDL